MNPFPWNIYRVGFFPHYQEACNFLLSEYIYIFFLGGGGRGVGGSCKGKPYFF